MESNTPDTGPLLHLRAQPAYPRAKSYSYTEKNGTYRSEDQYISPRVKNWEESYSTKLVLVFLRSTIGLPFPAHRPTSQCLRALQPNRYSLATDPGP